LLDKQRASRLFHLWFLDDIAREDGRSLGHLTHLSIVIRLKRVVPEPHPPRAQFLNRSTPMGNFRSVSVRIANERNHYQHHRSGAAIRPAIPVARSRPLAGIGFALRRLRDGIGFALRRVRDGVGFASVIARTGSSRRTPRSVASPGAFARGIGFGR
jgi:hypothetical protein